MAGPSRLSLPRKAACRRELTTAEQAAVGPIASRSVKRETQTAAPADSSPPFPLHRTTFIRKPTGVLLAQTESEPTIRKVSTCSVIRQRSLTYFADAFWVLIPVAA